MTSELYIPNISLFKWDDVYDSLGIKDFVYFISSPDIQSELLPIKVVFILFTILFLWAIIYFYINSSYIYYHYLQGFGDFAHNQQGGAYEANKRWKKIVKKTEDNSESGYKLAIVEADDLMHEILEDKGLEGENFEELINSGKKTIPNFEDILSGHIIRNSIVYDPDYKLDIELAKKVLNSYEKAIKKV